MTIHVTQTQRLIAETALRASGADELLLDPANIDQLVRAMLVIEEGRMQAYMLRGFKWSCRSRRALDRRAVEADEEDLAVSVDWFHHGLDESHGEAARRIRGNRVRRIRNMEQEAEQMRLFAELERDKLLERRHGHRERLWRQVDVEREERRMMAA